MANKRFTEGGGSSGSSSGEETQERIQEERDRPPELDTEDNGGSSGGSSDGLTTSQERNAREGISGGGGTSGRSSNTRSSGGNGGGNGNDAVPDNVDAQGLADVAGEGTTVEGRSDQRQTVDTDNTANPEMIEEGTRTDIAAPGMATDEGPLADRRNRLDRNANLAQEKRDLGDDLVNVQINDRSLESVFNEGSARWDRSSQFVGEQAGNAVGVVEENTLQQDIPRSDTSIYDAANIEENDEGEGPLESGTDIVVTNVGRSFDPYAIGSAGQETAETGAYIGEGAFQGEATERTNEAVSQVAVTGTMAATAAVDNPEQAAGALVGGALAGVGGGLAAGRVGRAARGRVRTAGGTRVDAEDITQEEVLQNQRTRGAEGEEFPGAQNRELYQRDPAQAVETQAQDFTPDSVEEFFTNAGMEEGVTLKKALDVEPEGPGRGRGGFESAPGESLADFEYETPGSFVGPELSPNFLRTSSRGEISLRPGLPDFGGQPTGVFVRTDVENPNAGNMPDFNQEMIARQGDTTAVTKPAGDVNPGEIEAIVPPGSQFQRVGSESRIRDLGQRVGIGSEFYTEFGRRRVPLRPVAPEGADADLGDAPSSVLPGDEASRSLDYYVESPRQPTDRPAPVGPAGGSSSGGGGGATSENVFGGGSSTASASGGSTTDFTAPSGPTSPPGTSGPTDVSDVFGSGSATGGPSRAGGSPSGGSRPGGSSGGGSGGGGSPGSSPPSQPPSGVFGPGSPSTPGRGTPSTPGGDSTSTPFGGGGSLTPRLPYGGSYRISTGTTPTPFGTQDPDDNDDETDFMAAPTGSEFENPVASGANFLFGDFGGGQSDTNAPGDEPDVGGNGFSAMFGAGASEAAQNDAQDLFGVSGDPFGVDQ